MKNIITLFSFILIITSCDVVEGPYEIETGNVTPSDTNTYVKKILIEDFTGHTCQNCPSAARELEAIHDLYGNQIIGLAIHVSKSFAKPKPSIQAPSYQYDFRTNWGKEWDDLFEISGVGLPAGMINRIGYPNEHRLGKDEWGNRVITELEKEIDFGISITTNITGNEGVITINTEILNNINGDYNLVVCLSESHIINWQKDGAEDVENYEHNHAFRSLLSDENLSASSNYANADNIEKTINFDLALLEQFNIDYSANTAELGNGNAGGWNVNNMSVVAYIYNTNTKEIVQVEEAHLNN
jgi:thiol-disulfide isomerase/thioredoxin